MHLLEQTSLPLKRALFPQQFPRGVASLGYRMRDVDPPLLRDYAIGHTCVFHKHGSVASLSRRPAAISLDRRESTDDKECFVDSANVARKAPPEGSPRRLELLPSDHKMAYPAREAAGPEEGFTHQHVKFYTAQTSKSDNSRKKNNARVESMLGNSKHTRRDILRFSPRRILTPSEHTFFFVPYFDLID